MTAPLIVTAILDPVSTAWFEDQRRRYFPAERLVVGAHVTLFHHLPGEDEEAARAALTDQAAHQAPMSATVVGPRSLGRDVAWDLYCPALIDMRRRLAERWNGQLTPQDRTWKRPHVTIQNKVTAAVAQATINDVAALRPPRAMVEGLALWRYVGGPWEAVSGAGFSLDPPAPCETG